MGIGSEVSDGRFGEDNATVSTHLMCPRPKAMADPIMVEAPLVPYHAATRSCQRRWSRRVRRRERDGRLTGCSARRYQAMVIIEKSGKQAASNQPSRNLVAASDLKLLEAAIPQSEIPHCVRAR